MSCERISSNLKNEDFSQEPDQFYIQTPASEQGCSWLPNFCHNLAVLLSENNSLALMNINKSCKDVP